MIQMNWLKLLLLKIKYLFKAKHLLFFSRLLEGNYPETSRLIPTESKTDVTVKTKEFLQAIDRASLLAREGRNNVVKFQQLKTVLLKFLPILLKLEK